LYNVLEENLVAGNQELESNMTLGLGRPF
jgi:hypothetical protein